MGYITQNQFLHEITKEDFSNSATKLNKISYVGTESDPENYGITPFGFT